MKALYSSLKYHLLHTGKVSVQISFTENITEYFVHAQTVSNRPVDEANWCPTDRSFYHCFCSF